MKLSMSSVYSIRRLLLGRELYIYTETTRAQLVLQFKFMSLVRMLFTKIEYEK